MRNASGRQLNIGPLSVTVDGTALRWLRWHGVEILRGIDITVRDRAWDTVHPHLRTFKVTPTPSGVRIELRARYVSQEVDLDATARVALDGGGILAYELITLARRGFLKNRVGLIVLHPMAVAGRAVRFDTASGSRRGRFPRAINPDVLATDLVGMAWSPARGLRAELTLSGDVWETEDQRNWTDASFKSYPTPLRIPYPSLVLAGASTVQRVSLTVAGAPRRETSVPDDTVQVSSRTVARVPMIGLADAADAGALTAEDVSVLTATRPAHLRVQLHADAPDVCGDIERAAARAAALCVPLELDVTVDNSDGEDLWQFGKCVAELRGALAAIHLFSTSSRSGYDTTPQVIAAFRAIVARLGLSCAVGGGTLANFTELNRAGLPPGLVDLATYAVNPQVHADDESSIVETLEVLPMTVRQARKLTAAPLSVVLTLKPRFNAAAPAMAALGSDGLPASVDPRQPSSFAGAWAVGAIAALCRPAVARLTCFETVGMRGVIAGHAPLHPEFPAEPGDVFPLARVLRGVGAWQGSEVLAATAPARTAVLACRQRDRWSVMIANLSATRRTAHIDLSAVAPQDRVAVRHVGHSTVEEGEKGGEHMLRHGSVNISLDPWDLAWVGPRSTTDHMRPR